MHLDKSVVEKIAQIHNKDYITEFKRISEFFHIYYIKRLTVNMKISNLLGQNCIVLLQTNLYRMKLLCNGYVDGLNKNNPLIAILTLRAIFETTGTLAMLHKKYNQYINDKLTYKELDETLRKLYLGIKDKKEISDAPDPINVMTLIDAVDYYLKSNYNMRDKKFRLAYDDLSERCHPNSFGYFLGHDVNENATSVVFSDDNKVHILDEYDLNFFSTATKLYKEIYINLRQQIEINEQLPFEELHNFKNHKKTTP